MISTIVTYAYPSILYLLCFNGNWSASLISMHVSNSVATCSRLICFVFCLRSFFPNNYAHTSDDCLAVGIGLNGAEIKCGIAYTYSMQGILLFQSDDPIAKHPSLARSEPFIETKMRNVSFLSVSMPFIFNFASLNQNNYASVNVINEITGNCRTALKFTLSAEFKTNIKISLSVFIILSLKKWSIF